MPDSTYTIRVGGTADVAPFNQAEAALKRCDSAANGFVNALKLGVGIDIGGRLVQSVAALPGLFEQLVQRGVAFNVEMSDSEAAIAKIIGRFQGLNAAAAKGEAGKAMAQIVELEPKTAGTLQSLVQGFSATAASSLSAGLSIQENIDLVAKFANAASNIKLPQEQLPQELRSILSGNITADSAIAKTLQITNADIAKAKELGTLYQFLAEKIGSLGEAGDTNAVRMSSLQSAIDKLLASATEPIFEEINAGLLTLTDELNKPETAAALKALGHDIAGLVGDGVKLTVWAIENAPALVAVAKGAGLLAVAFAAVKLTELLAGLAGMTVNLLRNTTAISAETTALAANTAAQRANAASRAAAAGAMVPPSMTGGGGSGPAKGGGFLGAPSAGGLLASGNIAVILGLLAKGGLEQVAANIETDARDREAKGKESTDGVMSAKDRLGKLTSSSERDLFDRDLGGEITQLRGRRNQRGYAPGLLDQQVKAYEQMRAAAAELGEEDFNRAAAAQAAAAAAKEEQAAREASAEAEAQNAEALQKYRNARGDAFNDDQRGRRTDAALAAAGDDPAALQTRIAELETELQTKPQLADNKTPLPDVQRRDTERDAINAQLEDLRAAAAAQKSAAAKKDADDVAAREKENDAAGVQALQDELALAREISNQRLATIDAAGGKETDIAARRRQEEARFAAERLATEDKIGLLQGESDAAREARHVAAATAEIQRAADMAKVARESAAQKAADTWQASDPRNGRIDGRSQRARGAGGELLEDQGVLQPGVTRSGLGTLTGPSMLDAFAVQTQAKAALQPSSLLPPTPALPPVQAGGPGQPQGQGAAAGAPVAQAADKVSADLQATAAALQKIANGADKVLAAAQAAQAAIEAGGGQSADALKGVEAAATAAGGQVKAAGAAATSAIEALSEKIKSVEQQLDNARQ